MSITPGGVGGSPPPRIEFFVYELVKGELLIRRARLLRVVAAAVAPPAPGDARCAVLKVSCVEQRTQRTRYTYKPGRPNCSGAVSLVAFVVWPERALAPQRRFPGLTRSLALTVSPCRPARAARRQDVCPQELVLQVHESCYLLLPWLLSERCVRALASQRVCGGGATLRAAIMQALSAADCLPSQPPPPPLLPSSRVSPFHCRKDDCAKEYKIGDVLGT
jgi:hypothetical protein